MSWWEQVGDFTRGLTGSGGDAAAIAAESDYDFQIGSGGGYYDPSDPDVYLGHIQALGSPDSLERGGGQAPGDSIMRMSQANGLIYTWGDEELRSFQQQIVAAGIVDADDIAFGARDALTIRAWQQLVGQSADAYLAGARLSPMDLLGQLVQSPIPRQGSGGSRGPGRQATNPDDVRAFGEQVAKAVLGRGELTDDEVAKVQEAWRAYERPFLGHATATPPGEGAQMEFMEEQIRELDPTKADARKVVGAGNVLISMLRGGQGG